MHLRIKVGHCNSMNQSISTLSTECVTWKASDYESRLRQIGPRCSGQNEKAEAALMAEFPPIDNSLGREDQPLVITDVEGNLLVWYLPGLISGGGHLRLLHSIVCT